jgi:hypothetical protein
VTRELKTYCFDLDGTLCTNTEGQYDKASPFEDRIKIVNGLFDEGHTILIFTARGSTTGKDWRAFTEEQLASWNVLYTHLQLGKPFAHIYVDDKAIKDLDFFL